MKKIIAFLTLLVATFGMLQIEAHAGTAVVATGIAAATKNSQQTKILDNGNGMCLVTFKTADTTHIYYECSTNLVTWVEGSITVATNTVANGGDLDLYYDSASSQVIFSYFTTTSEQIRYISCNVATNAFNTCSANSNVIDIQTVNVSGDYATSIGVDSNGKVMITYPNSGGNMAKASYSTTTFGAGFADTGASWLATNGMPNQSGYEQRSRLFKLASGQYAAFVGSSGGGTNYLQYAVTTALTWPGSYTAVWTGASTADALQWGATQIDTTNMYVLSIVTTSTFQFNKFDGTTLTAPTAPAWPTNGLAANSGIACTNDGTNIWCFVIRGDGSKTLSYNKFTVGAGTWGGWTTIETTTSGAYVSVVRSIGSSGNIGILYTLSDGTLTFACLTTAGANCSAGSVTINSTAGLTSSGLTGGPFTPSSSGYTITNSSSATSSAMVTKNAAWVTTSVSQVTLGLGVSSALTVSINTTANALAPGTYTDNVVVTNATTSTIIATLPVTLTVSQANIAVSPSTSFASSGNVGGAFSPPSTTYTLFNAENKTVAWTGSTNASWLGLSPSSGSLASGGSITVTMSIVSAAANILTAGTYNGVATFTNITDANTVATRGATLTVVAVASTSPIIFYTGPPAGPTTGGESNNGGYLWIFGKNFGSDITAITVTVNGVAVAAKKSLGASRGRSDIQKLIVQVGAVTSGPIKVTVGGKDSNIDKTFTTSSGRMFFADHTLGSNVVTCGSFAAPCQTSQYAFLTSTLNGGMLPGDTLILRGGTYHDTGSDGAVLEFRDKYGTAGNMFWAMSYPGETALMQNPSNGSALRGYPGTANNGGHFGFMDFVTKKDSPTADGGSCVEVGASGKINTDIYAIDINCDGYIQTPSGGGTGAIAGNASDVRVWGNYIANNGNEKLYHGIYISVSSNADGPYQGVSGIDIGWNSVYQQSGGNGIQLYDNCSAGHTAVPDPCIRNYNIHDNLVNGAAEFNINVSSGTGVGQIFNNVLSNCTVLSLQLASENHYGGACIALQGQNTQATVTNNTLYNANADGGSSAAAIDLAPAGAPILFHQILKNNIVYQPSGAAPCVYYGGAGGTSFESGSSNNLWYGCTTPAFDTNAQNGNPNLVNAGTDYHLQTISTLAIGHGLIGSTLSSVDNHGSYWASPPDIGAYAFGSVAAPPPGPPVPPTTATISVSPLISLSYAGQVSSTISPQTVTFTVTNTSSTSTVGVTISASQSWSVTSSTLFTLSPLSSNTFTYSLSTSVNGFSAGTYNDSILVTNTLNGVGNASIPITLVISAAQSGGGVTLTPLGEFTWGPSTGASGYKVYLTLTVGGATHQVKDVNLTYCSPTICRVKLSRLFGLLSGTNYYVSVSSYNNSGEGTKTPQLNFTFGGNVPLTPATYSLTP